MKTRTKDDFNLSGQFGIKGFPSLILKHNGSFTQLSNGYTTSDAINTIIKEVLK